MRPNKVKQLWKEGKQASVAWMGTPDTYTAEIMANTGLDALVLDMQHGMAIGPDRAATWLQAVSTTDTVPMVRVPWNEPFFMQWVLDAGAYGIIVPLVNNKEEAIKAGGACRYPPIGYRSIGPNRARFYGGNDYFEHANEEIICLVMVEDIRTVDHLEELAEAPGIDGFYIGPADLAISLGIPPRSYMQDSRHMEACDRVVKVARDHGLVPASHAASAEEAVLRFNQGFLLAPIITDGGAITTGAAEALKVVDEFRQANSQ